eukprot:NODE_7439_length_766_cov_632.444790_g7197_i0.p2 GENE.NODE_7439_length_766_cov_632.444790_g7197_i0~~NODE_7439_length_766_cov_632.444790_g7197_i0.p2  ORF type:complete len:161 (-),score=45.56 NODE_7439_length_766_cov_632.444790_g7197_i0:225-707(-)
MADEETGEYHTAESGASSTYPMQCGLLRKGGYCVMKGRPCKVIDYSTSKTGKHGHAKAHIIGTDIFTGKKIEELCPSSHNIDVPNVTRTEYQLLDIEEQNGVFFASLLDDKNEEKSGVPVPDDDVGKQIRKDFEDDKALSVSIIAAMGEELIVGVKELQN